MGSQHKKMYYGISENFMWRHTIRLMSQLVFIIVPFYNKGEGG
jgi:2-C-methyl-D-erythritol 4-phosphate cytidylyltransferase